MRNFFKFIRRKFKDKDSPHFNMVFLPLLTTLMYLYQINLRDGNIIRSIFFLTMVMGITTVLGVFIIMDMREADNRNKKDKWISIICLLCVIVAIGGNLYMFYPLIRNLVL